MYSTVDSIFHISIWINCNRISGVYCITNIPGGKGRPARKAGNLTAICEPIF
jgi:hypothetical protein